MSLEPQSGSQGPCLHPHKTIREIATPFFNRTFEAKASVCLDCGRTLWTAETQRRFHAWAEALRQEKRDIFQLQLYLPRATHERLDAFLKPFPMIPKSTLMRAMTSVFLALHGRRPEFKAVAAELSSNPSYRLVASGPRRKTTLQLSPMALLEVQSWTKRLELPTHRIVQEAVFKMLTLSLTAEAHLQAFWQTELRPPLELILRSV